MRAEDVCDLLQREHFVPLRVHMADALSHVIQRRDLAILTWSRIGIGVVSKPSDQVARRAVYCSLSDVISIEVLAGSYPPPIN
jgi:hypothetical protein